MFLIMTGEEKHTLWRNTSNIVSAANYRITITYNVGHKRKPLSDPKIRWICRKLLVALLGKVSQDIVLDCGRVPVANTHGCTAAEGLLYKPWSSVFPLPETLVGVGGTTWARNCRWILPENARLPLTFRDLLHAVNLRHGANGFTSLPKEGVLRIFFSPWKIR